MKRYEGLAIALAAALALPAFAGEKAYMKCKEDTQTCLNHMVSMYKTRGWLGIQMDVSGAEEKPGAWKVTKVIPGSPAEAAGFKADDILVSVNGAKFADNTEEKMVTYEKTKDSWVPGGRLEYVVSRGGKEVKLTPTLAAMPTDALATIIGMHMMEHASTEDVAKK